MERTSNIHEWTPEFNISNINKWLNYLKSHKLITIANNIGHLAPPFSISIGEKIYKEILRIYLPNEEKGGLMFASISKTGDDLILEIESIFEIENDVENEFAGYSKKSAYFPKRNDYLKTLANNFTQNDPLKIYLPIHFHTHPTRDKHEDIKYVTQLMHPLNMSAGDMAVSKERHIQFYNFSMFYMNTIITGDGSEHRIIFYGNNVTPEIYTGEKVNQVFTAVKDITEDIENEKMKIFTRIALGGLGLIGVMYQPYLMLPFLDSFAYALDKKEYWGKLEKKGTTIIKIPAQK